MGEADALSSEFSSSPNGDRSRVGASRIITIVRLFEAISLDIIFVLEIIL